MKKNQDQNEEASTTTETHKALYQEAIAIMKKLFPEGEVEGTVEKEKQQAIIELFEKMTHYSSFCILTDVSTQRIVHSIGVEKYLGYENIDIKQYFEAIPEMILKMMLPVVSATFSIANKRTELTKFMDNSVSYDLPLRRKDGNYILTKSTLYTFDTCPKGRIKSYLTLYIVLKEIGEDYTNISLSPRVESSEKLRLKQLEDELAVKITEQLAKLKKLQFSRGEKEVLSAIKQGQSNKEIVKYLDVTENTVKTYKNRILEKTRLFFGNDINFPSSKALVDFLEENKVLDLTEKKRKKI